MGSTGRRRFQEVQAGGGSDGSKSLSAGICIFSFYYSRITKNFELETQEYFFIFFSFSKAESTACGICWDYSISSASGISASWGTLYAKAVDRECVAWKGCRTRQVQRGL